MSTASAWTSQKRVPIHLVGIALLLLPISWFIGVFTIEGWLGAVFACFVFAGLIAGGAALVLPAQKPKRLHNFIIAAWVIAGLMAFGSMREKPAPSIAPAASIDWDKGVITPPPAFDPTTARPAEQAGPYGPNDRLVEPNPVDRPPAK